MDALLIAEWQKANPLAFIAIELVLPSATVRLTSGGTVVFDGKTFLPEHDDFGVLSYVGEIEDGASAEAVAPDLGFEVFTDTGLETLTAAAAQGSAWTLYWGAVDPSDGSVVGAPLEWHYGRLNTSTLEIAPGRRSLQIATYTEEQFQLLQDASQRLSNAFHQSVWTGELGLSHVSAVTRKIYWRLRTPRNSVSSVGGRDAVTNPGGRPYTRLQ
ncbi:hypothetical protein [Maricaulis sp.]|uniref:hypothetical protein n=1 Tax=Maricaulis sp. TaxID=1486257 RepID=UPI000C601549|nr:hypothetical protein [Maricaulis sp.]MAC89652.1 hypothetical protein [Maricaulis sp.]